MKERINLLKELAHIRDWFKNNDWKINKFVLGEWEESDPRWQDYLAQRAEKRARQDIINYILNGGN